MEPVKKICKNCGSDDFYVNKEGKEKKCRVCQRKRANDNYHKKDGLLKLQAWRKANPEEYKAQVKRSKDNERAKTAVNPEFHEHIKRLKRENSRKNYTVVMIGRARKRAEKYKLSFDITREDIIIPILCPILQIPLVMGTKGNYPFSPSLDRLDSSKGYTKDNIRVISMLANTMKSNATKEQLLTFCKNIPKYLE